MQNEINFEDKFQSLGEFYQIDSPGEVRDFLKDNQRIFVLLDEAKQYLMESFADEKYNLEMVYDPECEDCNHLVLRVYVLPERFHNGVSNDIEYVRMKLRPLRRELKVLSEFAIIAGVRYV